MIATAATPQARIVEPNPFALLGMLSPENTCSTTGKFLAVIANEDLDQSVNFPLLRRMGPPLHSKNPDTKN